MGGGGGAGGGGNASQELVEALREIRDVEEHIREVSGQIDAQGDLGGHLEAAADTEVGRRNHSAGSLGQLVTGIEREARRIDPRD